MRIIKLLLGAVIALVVLVVVGVAVLIWRVDAVAKRAIEEGGTYATGVDTSLQSASVSLMGGTFKMEGLEIDNPPGYKSPHFLTLQRGGVSVALPTLMEETVELPELTLSGIDVQLEKADSGANYDVILQNLKRFESKDPAPTTDKGSGKKIALDRLVIEDISVGVTGFTPLDAAMGTTTVKVPRIELTGLGSKGGLTTGQLMNVIVKTVLSATIEAGAGQLPQALIGEISGQLAQLAKLEELGISSVGDIGAIGGRIGEAVQSGIEEATGKLKEQAGDIGGQIQKGIGDLLGGQKAPDDKK